MGQQSLAASEPRLESKPAMAGRARGWGGWLVPAGHFRQRARPARGAGARAGLAGEGAAAAGVGAGERAWLGA